MKNRLCNQAVFFAMLKEIGLKHPIPEYKFHPTRKWRFDYAFMAAKVAIEVEGGAFTGGRHTRATGFVGDIEKYNEATRYGWRLLRVTPDKLCTAAFITLIKEVISGAFFSYIREEENE